MRSRLFWPLIALAGSSIALAAACFSAALFSEPIPRGLNYYVSDGNGEIFDRITSLHWARDRGLLFGAIVLAALGVAAYIAAFQSLRRARPRQDDGGS
jgi:hypothetical protein